MAMKKFKPELEEVHTIIVLQALIVRIYQILKKVIQNGWSIKGGENWTS